MCLCSPLADRSETELDSSITEGPSFSESLKHFKSFAGGRSASPASAFNKVSIYSTYQQVFGLTSF